MCLQAGLHLGAVTPEEIALSVLTEITRERRLVGHPTVVEEAQPTGLKTASAVPPGAAAVTDLGDPERVNKTLTC